MTRLARSTALASLVALSTGLALCLSGGEPPYTISVTFPGPLDIERGASVRYQGIEVGEVAAVELRQPSADAPAIVELTLEIDDRKIALREADVFEVKTDGLMGDDYVSISAADEPSEPLASGSRIAGTPPLTTRLRDSAGDALERFGDAFSEAVRSYREAEADEAPGAGGAGNATAP